MIQEIEVPEGKTIFPYFVDNENVGLAINCFASKVNIEYVKDDGGNLTDEETNTPADRARISITAMLDRQIVKYQEKQAKQNATIIRDIVS